MGWMAISLLALSYAHTTTAYTSTRLASRPAQPTVALITRPRFPHIFNRRLLRNSEISSSGRCARRRRNARFDATTPAPPNKRPSRHHRRHGGGTKANGAEAKPSTAAAARPERKKHAVATKKTKTKAKTKTKTKTTAGLPKAPVQLSSRKFWDRPRRPRGSLLPAPITAAAAAAATSAPPAAAAAAAASPRHTASAVVPDKNPSPPKTPRAFKTAADLVLSRYQRDNINNTDAVASTPRVRRRRRRPARQLRGRGARAGFGGLLLFRAPGSSSSSSNSSSSISSLLSGAWRGFLVLEGCCEGTWVGKASAHVLAGALASSHSVVAGLVVGLAVWASCAKRLNGGEDDWKQVARLTLEVAVLWYCHALPHGLGAGRPLRGNFGTGKAGDLLGACWHFLGQGAFIRLVAASGRLVRINVLEANGLLLGLSHLGNVVAGSRMRRVVGAAGGAAEVHTYQLRGFFSRTNGMFRERPFLSLPFDSADFFLAAQGILSATEREVVQKDGALASAFRDFAAQPTNTLDAHSLGAVGARNLMGMGFIAARVRMFGRPALSLGWTEKASNMCMVGDPICGSLLQKLLDPTCVMLKGRGHFYDAYLACVGCA